jgi:hypothetical protein
LKQGYVLREKMAWLRAWRSVQVCARVCVRV